MMSQIRTRMIVQSCVLLVILWIRMPGGHCTQGMWLPDDIPDAVMLEMRSKGLELSRDKIWNASGTGIANAVVNVGATGSFVTQDGLILTNHHVAFGAVQRISTPEKNYIEDGFLARTRPEEVPAHGYIAYLLLSSEYVTGRVLSMVTSSMSPLERYDAIEAVTKEIVREAEEGRDVYCEVNALFGGAEYRLDTYLKITDVRVVYVPSRAIGEYGGDIDNWMWPRHTGDFSFLRAYIGPDGKPAEFSEDNVPYRPKTYLKIATEGLSSDEFAMIIGFPGKTSRYLTSYALAHYRDFTYPEHIRLYRKMLEILDDQSEGDPVAAVRVASRVKGINNRLKNNEGMLDGFERFKLVELQQAKERQYREAVGIDEDRKAEFAYLVDSFLKSFESLYDEEAKHAMKDLLFDLMLYRSNLLGQAMRLYKWSLEKEKSDMERDPDFMDREISYHKMRLRVSQMGYHEGSDRALLRMLLEEFARLPEGRDREIVKIALGGEVGEDFEVAIKSFLDEVYANTKLDRTEERLRMFDLSHEELMAEGDPFIELASRLYDANEERIERDKAFKGSLQYLVPMWIELISESLEWPLYSDANGAMRLNYGVVRGYSPRDAVYYEPFTTLAGVSAKHTGIPPFDAPDRLLALAAGGDYGRYVHPGIGDVPVNLLTTHDSTGGNSGSPVLNGKGELVGCLFDGNYEAMTADFVFQDDITRSISVDIRYVLFVAQHVDSAFNVLEELGVD